MVELSLIIIRCLIMSCVMKKTAFCMCEDKGIDQLHRNSATDQHLGLLYIDSTIPSTIPLLPKSESNLPYSVPEQPGLCHTWSETQTGFVVM